MARQCFSVLQSGFVSIFEQKLQGLSRTIKVHANPTFPVTTDNEEAMENVRIKRVEFN